MVLKQVISIILAQELINLIIQDDIWINNSGNYEVILDEPFKKGGIFDLCESES